MAMNFRATILDVRQNDMPVVLDHDTFEAAVMWLVLRILNDRRLHSVDGTPDNDFRILEMLSWVNRLAQKKAPFVLFNMPAISTWSVSVTEGHAWSDIAAGRVLLDPLAGRHTLEDRLVDRYPAIDGRFAGVAQVPPVQTWPVNGGVA